MERQTLKPAKNVKPAKKAPSWLFVLQAKKGTITKTDKKGVYTLTIKHSDMGPAIAFTDRPDRIVKTITPEQLKKIGRIGPNSFEKDPPNAVLTARGMNAVIIEITSLSGDDLYRIKFIEQHNAVSPATSSKSIYDLTITVDSDKVDLSVCEAFFDVGGAQWATIGEGFACKLMCEAWAKMGAHCLK